ncbi:hypothetical protein [Pseudomonas nitroreducens]|uniref:hypothetical protein n=1 Tax=Pseudomonas nitroreducens TaxID=46680 RepID=UPI00265AEE5B|nr:hypothetical protein [Pseudomonas nitroreducens]MCP1648154.1 hypothetical protein [Pseudomonas nitroreducens]MCP1686729.1 hypothetical protein [Pseudomonas nitroreducens]
MCKKSAEDKDSPEKHKRIVIFPFQTFSTDATLTKSNWQLNRRAKIDKRRTVEKPKPDDIANYEFFNLGSKLDELKLRIQACVGPDETIYILGHCDAGSDEIFFSQSVRSQSIGYLKLASTLWKTLELNRNFAGAIKIYACCSAVDGAQSKSFSHKFACTMRFLKYMNCHIYGYGLSLTDYFNGNKVAMTGTEEQQKKILLQMSRATDLDGIDADLREHLKVASAHRPEQIPSDEDIAALFKKNSGQ